MTTGKTAEFIAADSNDAPFSAAAISADPIRGYVYIASYIKMKTPVILTTKPTAISMYTT